MSMTFKVGDLVTLEQRNFNKGIWEVVKYCEVFNCEYIIIKYVMYPNGEDHEPEFVEADIVSPIICYHIHDVFKIEERRLKELERQYNNLNKLLKKCKDYGYVI